MQFTVVDVLARKLGLQRHAALGAVARADLANLRMHGAGVDRAAWHRHIARRPRVLMSMMPVLFVRAARSYRLRCRRGRAARLLTRVGAFRLSMMMFRHDSLRRRQPGEIAEDGAFRSAVAVTMFGQLC